MLKELFNAYRLAFRNYIKQKTGFITIEDAQEKRAFWAKVYFGSALGLLLYTTYSAIESNSFKDPETGTRNKTAFVEKIIDEPTKVIEYRGFEKVGEYTLYPKKASKNLSVSDSSDLSCEKQK